MPNAIIKSLSGISDGSGDGWDLRVNVAVSDGGSGVDLEVTARAATFMPNDGWKPLVRQAIIEAAQNQLHVDVDAVLAPDLTFL